jgi:hypothetical protein
LVHAARCEPLLGTIAEVVHDLALPLGVQLNESTVRALAGHASLATTDRYARIARNDLAGAAAQLNSYISRTRGGADPVTGSHENAADQG